MDWNLGMSMSSNSCRSLNSPHVGLELKVSKSRGEIKTTNIQMSLPEFQVRRPSTYILVGNKNE